MKLSNFWTDQLFEEIISVDIDYGELPDLRIYFIYNNYDDPGKYVVRITNLFNHAKQEIFDNLLLMKKKSARQSYLKRLWLKFLDASECIINMHSLFEEGELLYGDLKNYSDRRKDDNWYGFLSMDRVVKITLPSFDYKMESHELLLNEYFNMQIRSLSFIQQYILLLGQTDQVSVEKKTIALGEFIVNFPNDKEISDILKPKERYCLYDDHPELKSQLELNLSTDTVVNELSLGNNSNGQDDHVNSYLTGIKNNFDHIPITNVFTYFNNALGAYISKEDICEFIRLAFDKKVVPEKRFNLLNFNTKADIRRVFSHYYLNVAGKPHGKQKKYSALLGEYFEGFDTNNVSTNFTK